jgi:hypothetical protein
MAKGATFPEYLRAFTARWFILMSGPLSVPFAIAAALVESTIARVILAGTAVVCLIFSSYWIWRIERESRRAVESKLEALEADDFSQTQWGNVRVADNPATIALFSAPGPDRNKFLALLTQSYISTWARPMGGHEDLLPIEGGIWQKLAYFSFAPKRDDAQTINQTYIRRNNDNTPLYYDVYVNLRQMQRVWPDIDLTAEG